MSKIISYARSQTHGVSDPLSGATVAPSNDHTDGSWSITDIYDRELMINTGSGKFQYRAGNSIYTLTPTSGSTGFLTLDMSPITGFQTEKVIEIIPGATAGNADIVCDPTTIGGNSFSYISFNANPGGDGMTIGCISGATYPSFGPAAVTNYQTGNVSTIASDGVNQTNISVYPTAFKIDGATDSVGIVTIPAGGGTVSVNAQYVQSGDIILLTPNSAITSDDFFYVDNIINSTSFDVTNINTLGGSVDVAWYIVGQ